MNGDEWPLTLFKFISILNKDQIDFQLSHLRYSEMVEVKIVDSGVKLDFSRDEESEETGDCNNFVLHAFSLS